MLPLVLALAAPVASAGDNTPMWGIGPSIQSVMYPFEFPTAFPKLGDDAPASLNGHTDEKGRITTLDAARGDLTVGAKGTVWMNREFRASGQLLVGSFGGTGIREFSLQADKIFFSESRGHAFFGGGVGFGRMKFDGSYNEEATSLTNRNYNARVHVGGIYRMKKQAVEVALFFKPSVNALQEYQVESLEEPIAASGGFYWHGGLEATYYFGDFTQRQAGQGGKNRGGKRGGRNGGR
jgi:hypothetical protein